MNKKEWIPIEKITNYNKSVIYKLYKFIEDNVDNGIRVMTGIVLMIIPLLLHLVFVLISNTISQLTGKQSKFRKLIRSIWYRLTMLFTFSFMIQYMEFDFTNTSYHNPVIPKKKTRW